MSERPLHFAVVRVAVPARNPNTGEDARIDDRPRIAEAACQRLGERPGPLTIFPDAVTCARCKEWILACL